MAPIASNASSPMESTRACAIPCTLAHLCEMLAWSVGTGLAVCWGLTAFAAATGAVMIRMEDAELEQRFGDAYREYRDSVPAVIPRVS